MLLKNKEKDLIEALRNYRKSYQGGSVELEQYAESLFYDLLDPNYKDD